MDTITDELLRQTALWRALTFGEARNALEETEAPAKAARSDGAAAETGEAAGDWTELARVLLRRGAESRTAINFPQRDMPEMADVSAHGSAGSLETEAAENETAFSYPAGSWTAEPARELSRVFERDARRYDGGFSLY